MMIRRRVRERLQALAGFLEWDPDPYLVITEAGRLVWMVDGYTTSDAHPYSRAVDLGDLGRVNYIRNAVKATVDAYDGETHLYIFAPDDPLIGAYQRLVPESIPRRNRKCPRTCGRTRAIPKCCSACRRKSTALITCSTRRSSITRKTCGTWRGTSRGRTAAPESVTPTYVVATLPGESQPEFLLMMPFTPRSKDNLIGLMVARCDGEHLGEMVVLLLSKQELIFGPMQIAARINQDQTISKDLTLWNQQGSQVLRGQTLVLPVDNTFPVCRPDLHPGHQARMPQLKKVVLAVGNRLIYADTYEEALAQLTGGNPQPPPQQDGTAAHGVHGSAIPWLTGSGADARLQRIADHLRKYQELTSQGRLAEAGKELEAIKAEVKQ